MSDVLLRAEGISKAFPDEKGSPKTVLDGLDLEIRRQSLVVIRGESGCGKSTLLRLLGLVDPDFEGSLEICGTRIAGNGQPLSATEAEDLRSRHIGFVFQDDLLLPLLNLHENSELPARIHHLPKQRISERLGRLQKLMFGPEELADGVMRRRRTHVSGGQRQRAAILRALSHGPDLILADEPTASLDPQRKAKVVELFRELCRAGATILVASHDSIFRDAGETYELADGKLTKVHSESAETEETPEEASQVERFSVSEGDGRPPRARGCPPGLQVKIALREALGNPLFAFMIVAAMTAGLFQLTLLWSVQAGTQLVLDDVINKGSRLDRVEVAAKAQPDAASAGGLPSTELLAELADYRRSVPRREILLRVDDSRGRERQETTFGLYADDPELGKLELREGAPFDDQHALALLITERTVERLFGGDAVGKPATGKTVEVRFRRYLRDPDSDSLSFASEPSKDDLEEIAFDFVVAGVVDRAEAGRQLYLPQGTLLDVATWQMDSRARLEGRDGRLELIREAGEQPPWERLHVYFDRLDQVLPAATFFERRGYTIKADLFRYKWILDTRRFVNWMIGGIIAMVMSIAGLLIVSNVVSSVRLKRKEIAVLKLMGMRDRDVVSIFVLSVLVCALLGGALGFIGGSLTVDGIRDYLAATYPESPLGQVLTSTWPWAGIALLLCSVVTIGFTVLPAWRTARKEAVWTLD